MVIDSLSRREMDVGLLVSEGLTNKEIAAELGVSQRRVGAIILRIKEKLFLNSKVEIGITLYQFREAERLELEAIN
ncbi:helix-turn-helix domain-containing protein [Alkalicoccobacillus gibsonii]|uniref:helix-turn-helix domain-containing protein n=1 Tax=Alkalicoccobacillus gibsonii TaxID=79881 RepID=UPI003F7BE3C5